MKKNYIHPTIEIYETQAQCLMANSERHITDEGNVDMSGSGEEADADEGCARNYQIFDNSITKMLLFLLMMATSLCASAQRVEPAGPPEDGRTHAMTIYFKNCSERYFSLEELDHVTYLPGIGIKVYLAGSDTSEDFLYSQMESIEYAEDSNNNANWEVVSNLWTDYPEAWRLEYPQLSYSNLSPTKEGAETMNQVIVKRTDDYGITYSLEWDNAKISNRWTCYQLHAGNTMATVSRHDDFKQDPEVAVSAVAADYNGSGFSRGHLCPSADRLCSTEQNKQTFFLTNMQPQYQSHNGGLWSRLETEVRDFATDDSKTDSHCDTLYIVKAATISDKVTIGNEQLDGVYADRCNGRLLVPKYFYMALLHYNKATDTYHALAFWTDHINEVQSVADLGAYAITINELERRTGIDFFCNLPDAIEDNIEATLDLEFWHLR